jgi:hypothetical protein
MIGFAVGVVAGVLQFWLLSKFVNMVTGGSFNIKGVALGLIQFFLPVIILVGVGFLLREELLFCGIGIAAALLISSTAKFIAHTRKLKGRDNRGI